MNELQSIGSIDAREARLTRRVFFWPFPVSYLGEAITAMINNSCPNAAHESENFAIISVGRFERRAIIRRKTRCLGCSLGRRWSTAAAVRTSCGKSEMHQGCNKGLQVCSRLSREFVANASGIIEFGRLWGDLAYKTLPCMSDRSR